MSMTTREAFEKGTETFNSHDVAGFGEVLGDDVVFDGRRAECMGREGCLPRVLRFVAPPRGMPGPRRAYPGGGTISGLMTFTRTPWVHGSRGVLARRNAAWAPAQP